MTEKTFAPERYQGLDLSQEPDQLVALETFKNEIEAAGWVWRRTLNPVGSTKRDKRVLFYSENKNQEVRWADIHALWQRAKELFGNDFSQESFWLLLGRHIQIVG